MAKQGICLTRALYDVAVFIRDYQEEHGRRPPHKIIMDALDKKSGTIGNHIVNLKGKGIFKIADKRYDTLFEFLVDDFHTDDIRPTLAERIKRIEEHLGMDDL